jgi:hypothetical protein
VHVSLKRNTPSPDAEIVEAPGLNVLEARFISGLMDHLQAISAFTMPTFGSYERQVDGVWSVSHHTRLFDFRVELMFVGVWKIERHLFELVSREIPGDIISKSSVLMGLRTHI